MKLYSRVKKFELATKAALQAEPSPETLSALADSDDNAQHCYLQLDLEFRYGFEAGQGAEAVRFYKKVLQYADQLWLKQDPSRGDCWGGGGIQEALLSIKDEEDGLKDKIDLVTLHGSDFCEAILELDAVAEL